ncbi:biotin carboxylase N-terminal domain-containing protein [Streptomyces sp. NPDC052016]|uniref:biotin carboxylase N-terminal domain-containing protein n=1 Tax=Streptomyces sp. NPDC052016 TaxID=3365680 RepID=UPI0037D8B619
MTSMPPLRKLLVANRGEAACRIFRAARAMGIATVGVRSADDGASPHVRRCDELQVLADTGPAAYLEVSAMVEAAVASGADALHPGYGFLSESPELARACQDAGVLMVGPTVETLTGGSTARVGPVSTPGDPWGRDPPSVQPTTNGTAMSGTGDQRRSSVPLCRLHPNAWTAQSGDEDTVHGRSTSWCTLGSYRLLGGSFD